MELVLKPIEAHCAVRKCRGHVRSNGRRDL